MKAKSKQYLAQFLTVRLNTSSLLEAGMNAWVAPHLTGGIGNRFFQFAATMGLAEKWKVPCIFHKQSTDKNDHGPADNIVKLYPQIPYVDFSGHTTKLIEPRNECFRFLEFPEEYTGNPCVVDGWRQTAKYFPKDINLLMPTWDAFLNADVQLKLQEKYGLKSVIERQATWFMHIRLGDYKILPHHQIPIVGYYETCLNQVPKGTTVLLFSDEPNLCSGWFEAICKARNLNPKIVIEDEIQSLFLMSRCWGGAVVANSTFSWWGAFFARLAMPNKESYTAFYPSIWGQGLPPAVDINPPWGTVIQIK